MSTDDYLLGHSPREWSRLAEQHALWGPTLVADLHRAGVHDGHTALEVGCGAGDLLEDLVGLLGAGRVTGVERDPAAAQFAQERVGSGATVHAGDLYSADLGKHDVVVARWVLSFLADAPGCSRAPRPGLTARRGPGGSGLQPRRSRDLAPQPRRRPHHRGLPERLPRPGRRSVGGHPTPRVVSSRRASRHHRDAARDGGVLQAARCGDGWSDSSASTSTPSCTAATSRSPNGPRLTPLGQNSARTPTPYCSVRCR